VDSAFEQLNRELTESREQIRRRDQLRRRLDLVEIEIRAQKNRLEMLRETLKQEEADVRRLEGLGVMALFATILGNKEKQLAKERQEALSARLKHDEASFAIEALTDEARSCREKLEHLADVDQRHHDLLDRKEILLRRGDKKAELRLVELAEQVGGRRADVQELEEVRTTGLKARESLDLVIDHLQKAENWGSWDVWGGGVIPGSMKYSNLDHARSHAHAAQHHLRAFHRELLDVGEQNLATIEPEAFLKFADLFFEKLLVDWVMQVRIQESLAAARKASERVRLTLDAVETRRVEARERCARAEQQRREFLEES
jgi:hypothetical protein